jgi:hypothetical protein
VEGGAEVVVGFKSEVVGVAVVVVVDVVDRGVTPVVGLASSG